MADSYARILGQQALSKLKDLPNGYRTLGSVQYYSNLPSTGNQVGDGYTVRETQGTHPAGRYAWGTVGGTLSWYLLDTNDYVTETELTTALTPTNLAPKFQGSIGLAVDLNQAGTKVDAHMDLTGGSAGNVLKINSAGTGVEWGTGSPSAWESSVSQHLSHATDKITINEGLEVTGSLGTTVQSTIKTLIDLPDGTGHDNKFLQHTSSGNSWKKVSVTSLDSTGATSGQILTADGNGGASWQNVSGGSSIPTLTITTSQVISSDPLSINTTAGQQAILENTNVGLINIDATALGLLYTGIIQRYITVSSSNIIQFICLQTNSTGSDAKVTKFQIYNYDTTTKVFTQWICDIRSEKVELRDYEESAYANGLKFVKCTQAEYNSITPDADTLYIIVG